MKFTLHGHNFPIGAMKWTAMLQASADGITYGPLQGGSQSLATDLLYQVPSGGKLTVMVIGPPGARTQMEIDNFQPEDMASYTIDFTVIDAPTMTMIKCPTCGGSGVVPI